MPDTYITLEEVAKKLGVSERTITRLIDKGQLKGFKVGRAWRFEPADVERFVEEQRRKVEQATSENAA